MYTYLIYLLIPTLFMYPAYTLAIIWRIRNFIENTHPPYPVKPTDPEVIYRRLFWLVPVLQHWMLGSVFHLALSAGALVLIWMGRPFNMVLISTLMLVNLLIHLWLTWRKLTIVDRDSRNVRTRQYDVVSYPGSNPELTEDQKEQVRNGRDVPPNPPPAQR